MTAQHFVVTAPDGNPVIFANVQNGRGFVAAMTASGKKVQPASAADLQAAGVASRLASSVRSGTAGLMVAPVPAAASSTPAPRPVAATPTASVRPVAPKPTLSLPDIMRQQHGLPLSAEGQATMAAKAAARKDLKVDIVDNMRKRFEVQSGKSAL